MKASEKFHRTSTLQIISIYRCRDRSEKMEERQREKPQYRRSMRSAAKSSLNWPCHLLIISPLLMLIMLLPRSLMAANCSTSCGQLQDIPYPFGIGDGCALRPNSRGSSFQLTCVGNTPLLGPYEVTNISLSSQEITIMFPVFWQCPRGRSSIGATSASPFRLPFPLSPYRNQFVALGCNILTSLDILNDHCGNLTGSNSVPISCASVCKAVDNVTEGACSGVGCCKIDYINNDISEYTFSLEDHIASTAGYDNCSYAFIVKTNTFVFSRSVLYSATFKDKKMPVVLGWYIDESLNNSSDKTFTCIDDNATELVGINFQSAEYYNPSCRRHGYRCWCSSGYEGNPYVHNGCTDIDECTDSRYKYYCPGRCINKPGSFRCKKSFPWRFAMIMVAVGFGGPLTALVYCGSAVMCCKWVRRRKTRYRRKAHFLKLLQQLVSASDVEIERTKIFSIADLRRATGRFSEARIIGRGGHGIVYKGQLTNQAVAIKTAKFTTEWEISQFINEVALLSVINHRNIVKLLGCCFEAEAPILVYEFVPNGTLTDHLHVRSSSVSLSWKHRLRIATEIARALAYLHSAVSTPIFHRDLKSANILLDGNLTVKLSDFGASKPMHVDQTHVTTAVQGTLGYLDPEYLQTGQLTEKCDVYSLGVILVELLTGRSPHVLIDEEETLIMVFLSSLRDGRLGFVIDPSLVVEQQQGIGATDCEILEIANLAARCLRSRGEERPAMKEVEFALESLLCSAK